MGVDVGKKRLKARAERPRRFTVPVKEHDYRPALARIAAPALVLHGELDLQPGADSRSYAEAIPGARFQVIPHAGHFVFDDGPWAFAGELGDFLRSAAGGSPR